MKACWKEDAQAVASEPQNETVIENVHKFHVFYNALTLQHLWSEHFFELEDNGLWGCIPVVYIYSRKWSSFRGICARPSALIGWWDRFKSC